MALEEDGSATGVLLLNSNAMGKTGMHMYMPSETTVTTLSESRMLLLIRTFKGKENWMQWLSLNHLLIQDLLNIPNHILNVKFWLSMFPYFL